MPEAAWTVPDSAASFFSLREEREVLYRLSIWTFEAEASKTRCHRSGAARFASTFTYLARKSWVRWPAERTLRASFIQTVVEATNGPTVRRHFKSGATSCHAGSFKKPWCQAVHVTYIIVRFKLSEFPSKSNHLSEFHPGFLYAKLARQPFAQKILLSCLNQWGILKWTVTPCNSHGSVC